MVGDLRGPGTLPRRLLPLAAVGLASAIGYVVLPQLAPASLDPEATVLVLGVVNGIALGLLLRLPARFTPAIAIGATVGVSLSWLLTSATALGSAITGVVVGGELVAIGWIMRRARAARLRDPRDLIVYTITVLAVSSLGATLVVIARSLAGLPLPGGAGSAWGVWVIDDVFGAVVIAPAVLTITWPRGIRWKVALEWMAAAGFSLLLTWQLFFRLEPDARGLFNWPFFVALGSLWIAVRMGLTAVAPVVAVQYWLGAVAAVSGVGVFVSDDVSLLDRLLSYEVLVITFALVTLALAVLHDARAETMQELARSEGLLSDVIDGSPAMVSAKAFGTNGDGGGRYILTNSSWEQFTAVPADEALGHTDVDLWGSAEGGGSVAVERTVVATGRPSDVIEQRTDAMGEVRELQTSTFPLRGPDGEVWGTGTIATDITELARSRRQVEEQAALLFAVFDASPTPAVRLRMEDSGGVRALDSNEAFERLLECDEGCVERTGLLEHVELDDVGWVVDVLEDARSRARGRGSGQQPHGEVRLQSHAGERIWAVMYAATVLGDTDDREIVVQFEDITARKSAEAALLEQATKDSVTGLPNRRVLHERLETALARLQRHPGYLAVLFCDLDRFKEVNDTLGHQGGDEFLAEVARRLADGVRPQDTVARLGGDEFVVLAEDLHEGREAITLALRLQDRLSATWEHGGRSFRPAMSVGIALSAAPQVDELEARGTRHRGVDELLRRADLAM